MDILDINVWLALVDQNHLHHASASSYWRGEHHSSLAFTRVSMLGLLRLSTRPGVLSRTLAPAEAWGVYQKFIALPNIRFLAEPAGLDAHFHTLTTQSALSHRLWTDAYLAAFATAGGHRLVSFDADFALFPGLDFLHLKP